ncbi:MAG: hypothetical protein EHM45_04055 [Desulfobacteraceae bacterium]|nr:MAG: hypothetical protein EHM45_04055 [Desulfobacteraceae bacterium]
MSKGEFPAIGQVVREFQGMNVKETWDMTDKNDKEDEKLNQAKVWEMLEGLMWNLKEVDAFLKTNKSDSAREIIMESLESYQKAIDFNLKNEPMIAYNYIKTASTSVWRALTLMHHHES